MAESIAYYVILFGLRHHFMQIHIFIMKKKRITVELFQLQKARSEKIT